MYMCTLKLITKQQNKRRWRKDLLQRLFYGKDIMSPGTESV